MSPGAEDDVGAAQIHQFADSQSGLDGCEQQRVVASSEPWPDLARRGGRRPHVVEERDRLAFEALGWDSEHAVDEVGVLGMVQRGKAEERVHGGKPGVSGADAVVPVGLAVFEERCDEAGVEVVDLQLGALLILVSAKPSRSRKVSLYAAMV